MRLTVGTIIGVHGIGGELKLRFATDDPEHLKRIKRVYIGDEPQSRRLVGLRLHAGMGLLRIGGVTTPEAGRELIGQPVRISGRDARPLEPGEFYLYQVVGIDAVDEAGEPVGRVKDVLETGANDVFVLADPAGRADIMLPNIPEVIVELDTAAQRMVVRRLRYWDEK